MNTNGDRYQEGKSAGAEQARADLLANHRIAAQYAEARLAVLPQSNGTGYRQGYLDGYRDTLNKATK